MDLASMMKTMLSADSIAKMSERTGASTGEVKSVLLSALPAMLSGVQGQANNRDTVAGFAGALESHAKDDTSDIDAFLSNVDIKDGKKIVSHLLGGEKDATTKAAAERAGLSTAATGSILGAVAPLLMSLLGQQVTQAAQAQPQPHSQGVQSLGGAQQSASSGGGLLGSLLGGTQQQSAPAGLGGLLGSLLGGGQQQPSAPQQSAAASPLSSLLGGSQQQQNTQQPSAASNPLAGLLGGMMGSGDIGSLLSGFLGSDQ